MVDGRQQAERSSAWERVPGEVAFRTTRENITRLIEEHPDAVGQTVPACPEWTVRDLLAHVVENCRAANRSRGPRPIAALGVPELLDEWAQTGPQVEARMAAGAGSNSAIFVMDTFTHELDLRRVVQEPDARRPPRLPDRDGRGARGFSASVHGHGLQALRIETEGAQWTAGWGPAAATLRAHPLDLYRSIAGRRTHQQIAELSWSAPARPAAAFTWGPFDPPAQATEELIGGDVAYR